MPSFYLSSELARFLTPEETVYVLSALRQDPLVWHSLQENSFLNLALEKAGGQVTCWNPGRLGLLAVDEPRLPEELRAEPMPAPAQALHEKALQAYQNVQRTGTPPASLREAALLAIALRERRRLTGVWTGLLQELLPKPGQNPNQASAQAAAQFAIWRTALACLYTLIPDPDALLRALLPQVPNRAAYEWVVLTRLSQPAPLQDHVQVFLRLLTGLPVVHQLNLLRALSLHGSETLAAQCAERLLIGHPAFANLRTQANLNEPDMAGLGSRALALQQMGTFYQLAGDHAQAYSLLNAAEIALNQWLAGIYLQRLDTQIGVKGGETLVLMESEQMSHLASASGWLKNDLGVVLVSHPLAGSIMEQVTGEGDAAFLQLKRALLMFEREPGLARDLARQGAAGLLEHIGKQGLPFRGEFVYHWRPEDAVQILLELDLPDEALSLAQAFQEIRPNDITLLRLTSKIYERLGRLDLAIRAARDLVALDPQSPAWQRLSGSLYGQAGNWEQSFTCWQAALSLAQPPQVADRLACAWAALNAGRNAEAVNLSEAILRVDANHGPALGLLGQALIAQGEVRQAVGYLVRATLLAPEVLEPWLALAHAQQELGEPVRSLETLRAAVAAVPEAPEGHLALGQACLSAGLPAEALPSLKKAFALSPEMDQAALLYGRTLRLLGHAGEARAVLERARSNWTTCPELAYEYAQALLDQGDVENALPVFEMALRNGLPVLDGYLLYARVLLGEYSSHADEGEAISFAHMEQAEITIRRILEIEPENIEARFLMADLLREKGDLDEAMEIYSNLADSPASEELHWRIQWGLGRTALRLNQNDIALAAFQEACQSKPNSLTLQRSLAEASLRACLPHEALEAAANALELAPDDVDNLAWYADFVTSFGETRKSVEALQRAVQIDPERAELWVSLANGQLSCGDLNAARVSLDAVADLEQITWKDLRRAGQAYLRLEDSPAALACFERALQGDNAPPADLLFEVAQLYERNGDLEKALDLSHQALTDTPESLPAYLLQADLLTRLNRPQAALALLERALRVVQGGVENVQKLPSERQSALVEIHDRFTQLMLQENNFPAALHHAEKALALRPAHARLCYQAADLALALVQVERADRTVRSFKPVTGPLLSGLTLQGREGLDLLCLKVEIALLGAPSEDTAFDELCRWVDFGLSQLPGDPRLLAARARLFWREGEMGSARDVFESALDGLVQTPGGTDSAGIWLAEASLELERWAEARILYGRYAETHPAEARAYLGLVRSLTLAAERQRLCEVLHCQKNAPGLAALEDGARQAFEDAVRIAGRLVNASAVARWQARGDAAFTPSAQAARNLAAVVTEPDDTAALMALLRQLNNPTAALQAARRSPEDPAILLELALCSLSEAAEEGMPAAEKAVEANLNRPLAHAARAYIAYAAGEQEAALESYEKALSIWPDEPEWHDAAADLCDQLGQSSASAAHRKQALALSSENALYAHKLGRSCLTNDNLEGAIQFMERSCELDPSRPEVWLDLAAAYHRHGRLPEALEAARKASELSPASAQGLLIAGETALSMKRPDQALEFAQGALRREPENPTAVLFLARVLVERHSPEEALAVVESAAPAVRQVFAVALERARLIHQLHGSQAALEVLDRIARDNPEEPELLGLMARIQAESGELKAAERSAVRALRLDPNQPDLTLMLGRIQRKSGQLDQAVQLLADAIRMDSGSLDAYLELGSVFVERREIEQALDVYHQAMRLAPMDYQAYYQCGLLLRDSKDYAGAEEMLRRAAELAPNNLSIRRQLVGVIALNLVHSKKEASLS